MECELPLSGAPQGQHNWWTKGLGGSRRTLRNWTGDWTTVKSVAQEGRKVKPIPPTTTDLRLPLPFTDRKTTRTGLTRDPPQEKRPTQTESEGLETNFPSKRTGKKNKG